MRASSTSHFQKLGRNRFLGAHSSKACPDLTLNHRCRSIGRGNRKRRDSRYEKQGASTNLAVRYCRTQQYSITALTDSSGVIKERYAYDAYGNLSIFDASGTARTSTAEGNRYAYTGREWDEELGLYHYRARMYNAVSGRFCSTDPIGYEGSRWGLYEYADGMPLDNTDPMGLWTLPPRPGGGIGGVPTGPKIPPPKAPPKPKNSCGLLKIFCSCGIYYTDVFPNSTIAKGLIGSGCVTLPTGIHCSGSCTQAKTWASGDNPTRSILDHEGCHYCALKCGGCIKYLGTAGAAPDGCVGNEVQTTPGW